ncbi:MAG: NUDIX hydrolase [Candidatus Omnitrophica bacterium]|nr:NUDIX hydrolase [Candidatus Omnitrophota bacterium]
MRKKRGALLKSKRIFKGRLLNLYVKRQRFPNGYIGSLEVIRHPGAVLIVPLLKDKVILIRQYRPVINSYIWELPAGTLHKGERPLLCAKRELIEEIGYSATKWKRIGSIYPAPGYATERIIIYKAQNLKKTAFKSEEDEIITPRIFEKKQINHLLRSGKIVDAKTICALKLAAII